MLENRSAELEIMDDLDISGPVVAQTLRELNTINKLLGGNQISVTAFKHMIKGYEEISLVDLGCGGGDIMVEMAKCARKNGTRAEFLGIDANKHIVDYAVDNTRAIKEIRYEAINIFSKHYEQMKFDIVHCCLFLHHFSTDDLIKLFKSFRQQANVGVIVNDLHRHPIAYWSIKLLTSLFSRSKMVRNDAAVSVARGFKKSELIEMMKSAGIENYSLRWKWAFRWELTF